VRRRNIRRKESNNRRVEGEDRIIIQKEEEREG
jgi:hypothetical protein